MPEPIKLPERVAYGFGDAASSIFWKFSSMYLLFFYTDIVGLAAAAVGTMFLVTRIWDALADPLAGMLADRTRTRWGKFRPYLLWAALPFGAMSVLTFTAPRFSPGGNLACVYATYTVMMLVYTLANVPYASLLGVMSPNPAERTTLSSYRMIFAFGGSMLALGLAEPLLHFFDGGAARGIPANPRAWTMTAAVFAILIVVFFLLCFAGTRERVTPMRENKSTLRADLRDLVANRPWWILLGSGISVLIFNSIRDGGVLYYIKYYITNADAHALTFLGITFPLSAQYFTLGQAANIAGILLVMPVTRRIGKKRAYLGSMLLATLLSAAFYFVGPTSIAALLALQALVSMCAGSIFPLLWSMYADIADYSEWKTGRRATGLVFSSASMSQKFGWTLGGALSGWLLGYYGFQANVEQTEFAKTGIRLMISFLPAAGAALAAILVAFYPLSEAKILSITGDLATRRGQPEK
jgi:GPH family glycoside/pentoside/hexuronide:cation symporter